MSYEQKKVFLTMNMKLQIDQWRETLPQREFDLKLREFIRRLEESKEDLLRIPAGVDRARSAYAVIDHLVADVKKHCPDAFAEVTCRAGCAGCCHQSVQVSLDEVELLAQLVESGRVEIDRDLLKRQAEFVGDETEWWKLPASEKRCVFLNGQNKCSVYEDRPITCRKYFVTTDPAICSTPTAEVGVMNLIHVEIFGTAAADIDQNEKRLPISLYERLNKGRTK